MIHHYLPMLVQATGAALVFLLVFNCNGVNATRALLAVTATQYDNCQEYPPGTKLTHNCADGTTVFCCKAKVSANQYAGCCREVSSCGGETTGGWYMLCCFGVVSAGRFTTDKPDMYCSTLGLQEPSVTVWANGAGPLGQKTSAIGQAPWAGSTGQPSSQSSTKSPPGSVGKVTIDEQTPTASATVPSVHTDAPGGGHSEEAKQLTALEEEAKRVKESLDVGVNDLPHGLDGLSKLVNDIRRNVKGLSTETKQQLHKFGKLFGRLAPLAEKAVTACVLRCCGCALVSLSEKKMDCMGDCAWNPTKYTTC